MIQPSKPYLCLPVHVDIRIPEDDILWFLSPGHIFSRARWVSTLYSRHLWSVCARKIKTKQRLRDYYVLESSAVKTKLGRRRFTAPAVSVPAARFSVAGQKV
jgi:hypothetical protein